MIIITTQEGILSLPKRSHFSWKEELVGAYTLSGNGPFFLEQTEPLWKQKNTVLFSSTEATGSINPKVAINALQGVVLG